MSNLHINVYFHKRLNAFIRDHPDLEQLFIECVYDYVPSVDLKLSKLKTLVIEWGSIIISKGLYHYNFLNLYFMVSSNGMFLKFKQERMDILANFSPNLEALRLLVPYRNDEEDLPPGASLSTINFKKLTSLSLSGGFQLHDGAFLLSVI